MSTQQGILAVIVIGLIGVSLPCLAGRTTMYTEHSVEELKLMTIPELAGEARLICKDVLNVVEAARSYSAARSHKQASEAFGEATRGQRYSELDWLVIRDRHGGQMPPWFEEFSRTITSLGSPQACDAAATAGGWRPKP
jgi:hypothetical protein